MQKIDQKSQSDLVGNIKFERFTLLNGAGCNAGIFVNKISSTTTNGYTIRQFH